MFNASAAKTSSCLLRTHYTVIEGWTAKANSIEIEFGSAFHLFVKSFKLNGGNYNIAMKEAKEYFASVPIEYSKYKQWMDEAFLLSVCFNWGESMANDDLITLSIDGNPLVEQKFALPYYVDDEVEVLLCGTIDDIARKGKDGAYIIRDYKTTSAWEHEEYLNRYRLSPQLMFYKFIIQLYAQLYPQSLFTDIVARDFGCQIEGIFLKNGNQKAGTKPSSTIKRSEVFFFKQEQMTEFKRLLDAKIMSVVAQTKQWLKDGARPDRYGMLNGSCYGCPFDISCGAPDAVAAGHMLRNNFQQKPYNPLDYNA